MAKKKSKRDSAGELSFEEAIGQLEATVGALEEGEIGLDEALGRYEQGVKLLRQCYEMLENAQRRIELVSGVDAEGNPISTPLADAAVSLEEKARSRGRRRSSETPPKRGGNVSGDADDNDIDVSERLF